MSQDPVFVAADTSVLSDPQQMNAYSYGRGNPLIYSDKDGKKAEVVYRQIYYKDIRTPGAHAFILITPNEGQDHISIPGYEGQQKITIGGYPTGGPLRILNGTLNIGINRDSDYNLADGDYIRRDSLAPPDGMSVENYDNFLVKMAEAANKQNGGLLDDDYGFLGNVPFSGANNSNNTTAQMVQSSGGAFNATQFPGNNTWAPGIGSGVFSPQQSSLVSSFLGAFKATNAKQAQAVLNVVKSFFGPKK